MSCFKKSRANKSGLPPTEEFKSCFIVDALSQLLGAVATVR